MMKETEQTFIQTFWFLDFSCTSWTPWRQRRKPCKRHKAQILKAMFVPLAVVSCFLPPPLPSSAFFSSLSHCSAINFISSETHSLLCTCLCGPPVSYQVVWQALIVSLASSLFSCSAAARSSRWGSTASPPHCEMSGVSLGTVRNEEF